MKKIQNTIIIVLSVLLCSQGTAQSFTQKTSGEKEGFFYQYQTDSLDSGRFTLKEKGRFSFESFENVVSAIAAIGWSLALFYLYCGE